MQEILSIGDRVRIISWPDELHATSMHPDTVELYRNLICSGDVLIIHRIDAYGIPYGKITINDEQGDVTHSLGLNHSKVVVLQE